MNLQEFLDAAFVGRVLSSETVFPQLEAFSENAIYCRRGMPTMNKYKTVKEVCELTGLTRKHLYYFHHSKVVQATAHSNYSVYGYDGYKLYDDEAIEKLQQIALYYQLGLKRDEIRDIMLDPNYDSNLAIEILLSIVQKKKATIERHIAALEFLKLSGAKNQLLTSLRGISLEELGETILNIREDQKDKCFDSALNSSQLEAFTKEFIPLLQALQKLDNTSLKSQTGSELIQKIFALGRRYMGNDGCLLILGLFASSIGDRSALQKLSSGISPEHGKAVIQHFIRHPELYSNDLCGAAPQG